jgi:hypothetical protein
VASGDRTIQNPLVAKLSQFIPLSVNDIGVLRALCAPEERFRAGANIVAEGGRPQRPLSSRVGSPTATASCWTAGGKS